MNSSIQQTHLMRLFHFASFFRRQFFMMTVLGFAFSGLAFANGEVPAIHPTPQQITVSPGQLIIGNSVGIIGAAQADPDALKLLKSLIPQAKPGAGKVKIVIGQRGGQAVQSLASSIPKIAGGYRLIVTPGEIMIAGDDGTGTYYAVQTLRQILQKTAAGFSVPLVNIRDYPDVANRGVVEGFYGTPWSFEDRLSLLKFYGRNKLNTYIYGPKNDRYDSTPDWRKPYPPEQAKKLEQLVKVAKENKVNFVWGIHPGGDIHWNEADAHAVLAKLQAM